VAIYQMIGVRNELLFASALMSEPADQPIQPAATALIGRDSTNWAALTSAMTLSALPGDRVRGLPALVLRRAHRRRGEVLTGDIMIGQEQTSWTC
jgi:hypothetical protein